MYNLEFMSEIVPERLREAMDAAGISQMRLAELVGLKQPSIGRLLSGETRTSRAIVQIAAVLNTSAAYLMGNSDDASIASGDLRIPSVTTEAKEGLSGRGGKSDADMVEIAELDLAFGMGGGAFLDEAVRVRNQPFGRRWLRNFTDSPFEALRFARGMGDSMMPTILDADIVLIDTAQQTPRMSDQIWAIHMHGLGMIKRLRAGPDGSMKILSDNPSVPEEIAYDGEMQVLGRVVAAVRRF